MLHTYTVWFADDTFVTRYASTYLSPKLVKDLLAEQARTDGSQAVTWVDYNGMS